MPKPKPLVGPYKFLFAEFVKNSRGVNLPIEFTLLRVSKSGNKGFDAIHTRRIFGTRREMESRFSYGLKADPESNHSCFMYSDTNDEVLERKSAYHALLAMQDYDKRCGNEIVFITQGNDGGSIVWKKKWTR